MYKIEFIFIMYTIGPPVVTENNIDIYPPSAHSNVILLCNFTSNPFNYPIHWYKSSLNSPLLLQPITSTDHYIIANNTLTIHSITSTDAAKIYTCNITNQCGSVTSSMNIYFVIDSPGAPRNLIIQGFTTQSVSISWTPPTITPQSPIASYDVRLKEQNGIYKTYQTLQYYSVDDIIVSETAIAGLVPGTNYTVRVYSINQYFQNGSNEVSFKTNTSGELKFTKSI